MITFELFEAGFCRHCERMTLTSGRLKSCEYPAMCVLIKHDTEGYILFDTGYSDRFFKFTKYFPYSLFRYLTPVTLAKSLKDQLIERGIQPTDIKHIVISHFHADHIGGLRDFPNATFICHQDAIEDIKHKNKIAGLLQGFLPGLLPANFYDRLVILDKNKIELDKKLAPFSKGYDLFGDQQLIAIPLPGHAKGQIGLYMNATQETFLIADSCWHQDTFKDLIYPSNLTYLIHDNKEQYIETINKLHVLYKQNKTLDILPSHCLYVRKLIQGMGE